MLASREASIAQLIERHFPRERDIAGIELGCGYGAILHFARRAGYRGLRGVDASPQQVELAQRLGIEGVSQGDLWTTLERLESGSQDLVIAFDVIEHLAKPELVAFVDAVHRVLRPGGRWIINTPNGESPLFGRVRYGDLTHELAFTRLSLSALLLASGFERVECHENAPVARGLKGRARWLAWQSIRLALRFYVAAESGDTGRAAIFTQNLLAVAWKQAPGGPPRLSP
jgi:2-polyprenyl-3-methyl-5-hydroxy-6-metoxy-1,4-benzoquinol methylase